MKYKVIGWTYYENTEIMTKTGTISFAERNAIIDEIRKHKYLFSGWHHQESWEGVVPILNDGKKRCFSQRGWGGLMAEAYGYTEDYDYALFSFRQSVTNDKLHYAKDNFNIYGYTPKIIENEQFIVNVNEGLFNIAKTSNPFYLEDLNELRYIDSNDTITLCYNNESLTFVVKDINRNKTNIDFNNSNNLIKGKFKIIVTHKPESEKVLPKLPIIITGSNAFTMFEEALEGYNYDVIEELFNCYNIDYLSDALPCSNDIESLTRFVKEYVNSSYNSFIVIDILKYLDDYELYEQIAIKTIECNENIYISFINYYLEKDVNMDSHIFNFVRRLKAFSYLSYDGIDILFKAICLKPNNKTLRKKYYVAIKNTSYVGLPIMAGANLFNYLRKEDKRFIDLNNYNKYSDSTIMDIIEYLTYPNNYINEDSYPFRLPKIYENDEQVIVDGVKAYQKYINEHFEIETFMEDMIHHGIEKKCFEMDRYLFGIEEAAKYIYSLDILTNYKYNLKEYVLMKYSNDYESFKEEIESIYLRFNDR